MFNGQYDFINVNSYPIFAELMVAKEKRIKLMGIGKVHVHQIRGLFNKKVDFSYNVRVWTIKTLQM